MRIVWKDSNPMTKPLKTLRYRGHIISQYGNGWITDISEDSNIYYPRDSALNALDEKLGGKTRKKNPKRHKEGIHIIGKKS